MDASSVQKSLENAIFQLQKQLQETGNQALWQTLKKVEEIGTLKLQEIIFKQYYLKVPTSEYYDRTGQLMECGRCKATQGGGHYVLQVWLDRTALHKQPPIKKGNFWSYAYFSGRELSTYDKEAFLEEIDESFHIFDAFEEWFQEEYPDLFEENFNLRMHMQGLF